MLAPIPQRTHSSHSISHYIRRSFLLLLTLSLLTAPLAAQTDQAPTRTTAERLLKGGLQLLKEGRRSIEEGGNIL